MKQIPSTDFRKTYANETEPVEVTTHGKVIGTWVPTGQPIPQISASAPTEDTVEPVEEVKPTRMTIRPEKGPRKVLKQEVKEVPDPLVLRRLERERWSALQDKLSTGRKRAPTLRSE